MHYKFYSTLSYPIPHPSSYYLYIDEIEKKAGLAQSEENDFPFSWDKPCDLMDDYRQEILSHISLYQSLPFVRQIFLCNSISFNALRPGSDIDIMIVTKHGFLWLARFFSLFFFVVLGLKRSSHQSNKKFCLSFYLDEENLNIYHIRQQQGDIYLPYRLAHAVLLYSDDVLSDDMLRKKNVLLLDYLPNHPLHQTIDIGVATIRGSTFIKRLIEAIFSNKIGLLLQYLISFLWKLVLYCKRHSLSKTQQKEIIVSDTILKFHHDKRSLYQFKTKSRSRG